ncbi:hypothetical protein ACLOJK_038115 [Asimina triloba]
MQGPYPWAFSKANPSPLLYLPIITTPASSKPSPMMPIRGIGSWEPYATTLSEFPAPMTLCSVTSFIGVIFAAILQYIQEGRIEIGTPLLSSGALVALVLVGGGANGLCIALQAWSMRKRGPVLVSMFGPFGTVCTAILSAITLGEVISLGSVGGMGLMFGGLYFVLWAKKKEGYGILEEDQETLQIHDDDEKKPLLIWEWVPQTQLG